MAEAPAAALDINVYTQQTIPAALAELMDNHSKMQQISAYCKQSYVPGSAEATQIYDQTQSYAKNALLNVAYHIQTIGTHLTTLTQLQLNEVDKLDLQIKYLSQRIDMIHDASGTNVFRGNDSARPYKSTLKDRKVESDSTRAPQKFVRKQVQYGISAPTLQHQQSNGSLSDSQGLPPPPPSYSNAPNNSNHSSQSSTPTASPSYTSTPPPVSAKPRPQQQVPPSLNMPPSIPVRPPSMHSASGAGGGGDFPPPPPPSSFDLPPPPPPSSFDLPPPPPPSFDLPPPPPPSSFDLPPPPPPM